MHITFETERTHQCHAKFAQGSNTSDRTRPQRIRIRSFRITAELSFPQKPLLLIEDC